MAATPPPSAEAYNNQASALMRAGRAADAIAYFRQAITLRAAYPEAHFGLANAFAVLGRYEEAVAAYRRTISLAQSFPQPHNNLGSALMALGRTDEAIDAFRGAIGANKSYPEAYYNLGLALAKKEKWEDAIAAYRQAIRLKPRYPEARNNLGIAFSTLGQLDEAIEALQAALTANPSYPDAYYNLGSVLAKQGKREEAAAAYRKAISQRANFFEAHNNLGNTLLEMGRPEEAVTVFRALANMRQLTPEAYYNFGEALARAGQPEDAIAALRQATAARPDFPEAQNSLGSALLAIGQVDEAQAIFQKLIAAHPAHGETYCNLGNLFFALDRGEDAVDAYREAARLKPDFAAAHHNLSIVLLEMGQPREALEAARRAIALAPDAPSHHIMLGNCLKECEQADEAVDAYRTAAAKWPENAEILTVLANILLLLRGRFDPEARELLQKAARLRPVGKRVSAIAKPAFSALLINAPGIGNTPVDYLVARAPYGCTFTSLLPDVDYDIELLRANGDVVVNLVSDVDWGREWLPQIETLLGRLGRPIINHPRDILKTGREQVAERLAGLSHCRVSKIVRRKGTALLAGELDTILADFAFPVLVRIAGTHGGDDFAQFSDAAAIADFITAAPAADYYLSEYAAYESADGYFRKYRFIFADGRIFPYHLAIHNQWKVHYFRTDMANHDWMRKEEEAFVTDPRSVFGPEQWNVLVGIQRTIGLDYFGVDCGLDQQGNVVVFEANATMLVHGERGEFAYKQPAIARIKDAFDAMLAKAAQANKQPAGHA